MKNDWLNRFREVLTQQAEGGTTSMRRISLAAGLGPNYLQQMIKDGKAPTIDRLMAVLDTMGTAATLYVITGYRFLPEDEEFLKVVLSMGPEARSDALTFLRVLKDREDRLAPQA